MGFISATQTAVADKPLYLHYSATRQDYATTAEAAETINGYQTVATLGYIASEYELGTYE